MRCPLPTIGPVARVFGQTRPHVRCFRTARCQAISGSRSASHDDEPSLRPSDSKRPEDGRENKEVEGDGDRKVDPKPNPQRKRRPPLQNSLHRVAIVAQKAGAGKNGRSKPGDGNTGESAGSANSSGGIVSAVCVAESFDMEQVAEILTSHNFTLDPDGAAFTISELVHARGANDGDIFVFPSGTVVTWALGPVAVMSLSTKILLPAAGDPFVEEREVEELKFVADPEADVSRVSGASIVIGTRREAKPGGRLHSTLDKIAFSSGLARSTKLAVLESWLQEYLEEMRQIPEQLSRGLAAKLSRERVLRQSGQLLELRSQLNHYHDLIDALPDLFWDGEQRLETYYSKIGRLLDISVRIRTLNNKLDYAQDVVSTAGALLNLTDRISGEKHSTRLEWIIIILIALEVGFELRRMWNERGKTLEEELLAELRTVKGMAN